MSTISDNSTMIDPAVVTFSTLRSVDAPPTVKRWHRDEYYRLGEQGWFVNQRVELIDGEIVEISPQSFGHYWSIDAISTLLEEIFGEAYWVRAQAPCTYGDLSEPEPDISVVAGPRDRYADHPTTAVLVVEVSHSTLAFDRGIKASLYASMGVPDYWVVDLDGRRLWVHRRPAVDSDAHFGHNFTHVESVSAEGHVSPLEKPNVKLAVADMLPPPQK